MKTKADTQPGVTVYTFETSREAWAFMHECDKTGKIAGYPSLKAPYTVKLLTPSTGKAEHGTVL